MQTCTKIGDCSKKPKHLQPGVISGKNTQLLTHLENVLLSFSVDGKDAFVSEEIISHSIQHTAEPIIDLQTEALCLVSMDGVCKRLSV